MQKLYIISTCLGQKKKYFEFHFVGFYKGKKVKKVRVECGNFEKDKSYLIKLKKPVVEQQVLYAKCVKHKKLFY